jgi:methionyl aminopeptidase
MLPNIYTEKEIKILREGGKLLNMILHEVVKASKKGVTLDSLNSLAEELIKEKGGQPAFLNYRTSKFGRPYPSSLCASVNDEVVHGVARGNQYILQEGDIVNLDLGLTYKGLVTDKTLMVGIGKLDSKDINLMETTKSALEAGIKAVKEGNTTNDIGQAIEEVVKSKGFFVVRELGGHGVGRNVHEEPFVPNFREGKNGTVLKAGMVLALEPIVTFDNEGIFLDGDGHTYKTVGEGKCAQWEDTILVKEDGFEILTR